MRCSTCAAPQTEPGDVRYRACHLGLGKLYRGVGRREAAHAELATAVALLREMGMVFWLPEAEAALAATTDSPSTEPVG